MADTCEGRIWFMIGEHRKLSELNLDDFSEFFLFFPIDGNENNQQIRNLVGLKDHVLCE